MKIVIVLLLITVATASNWQWYWDDYFTLGPNKCLGNTNCLQQMQTCQLYPGQTCMTASPGWPVYPVYIPSFPNSGYGNPLFYKCANYSQLQIGVKVEVLQAGYVTQNNGSVEYLGETLWMVQSAYYNSISGGCCKCVNYDPQYYCCNQGCKDINTEISYDSGMFIYPGVVHINGCQYIPYFTIRTGGGNCDGICWTGAIVYPSYIFSYYARCLDE